MGQMNKTPAKVDNGAQASPGDDALMRRYVDTNDRDALEVLFRRHAGPAYGTALRVCRNAADAQDAIQIAFMKIAQRAASYRGASGRGVAAWITRIVINTCKERIRSEVRRRKWEELAAEEHEESYLPEDPAVSREARALASAVLHELNALPERYRLPILLHHCQGMSRKDTAAILSVSGNTLHMQLKRGLERLRGSMDARGVSASLASISATLLTMRAPTAPASLLENLHGIAHGVGAYSKRAVSTASVPEGVKWPVVLVVLIGAGIGAVTMLPGRRDLLPAPAAGPLSRTGARPMHYHWTFESSDVPNEFRVMKGSVQHIFTEDEKRKGALLTSNALIRIEIPTTNFPFLVSFKAAGVRANSGTRSFSISSKWLPNRHLGTLLGASQVTLKDSPAVGKRSNWVTYNDYYTGSCISRWADDSFLGIYLVPMESDGRVTLTLAPMVLLDELTIRAVATNDLPDVSLYLRAIEKIPPEKRKGDVPVPGLKPGRKGANSVHAVIMRYYKNCTAFDAGTVEK